ncbi:hypothetical protein EYD10_04904, partial [Varanus komodoensis]
MFPDPDLGCHAVLKEFHVDSTFQSGLKLGSSTVESLTDQLHRTSCYVTLVWMTDILQPESENQNSGGSLPRVGTFPSNGNQVCAIFRMPIAHDGEVNTSCKYLFPAAFQYIEQQFEAAPIMQVWKQGPQHCLFVNAMKAPSVWDKEKFARDVAMCQVQQLRRGMQGRKWREYSLSGEEAFPDVQPESGLSQPDLIILCPTLWHQQEEILTFLFVTAFEVVDTRMRQGSELCQRLRRCGGVGAGSSGGSDRHAALD